MNDQLKNRIMEQIKKDEIKMKPKWKFLAAKFGAKSGWLILILTAAAAASLLRTLINGMNVRELLDFGGIGLAVIIKDFPYLVMFLTAIIVGLAVIIFIRLDDNYKIPRLKVWLTILLIVGLLSLVLSLTGIIGLLKI